MRYIIRVSPQGHLTTHLAGQKPIHPYQEKWQVLVTIKDRKERGIFWIVQHAYQAILRVYNV